jgi:3-oxoacyl-[acyl-carrier-protein] synthase III
MGIALDKMKSYFEFQDGNPLAESNRQVFSLAERCIGDLLTAEGDQAFTHVVIATTCPDMLAPSLGQMLVERYHEQLSNCHAIDLVQGCAGGVTALILGSQLAALHQSSVLVVQADAAKKATSSSQKIHHIFGNGAFACAIHPALGKGLIHFKSRQYKDLSEVVTVRLGHDADSIIKKEKRDMGQDPRKHLGLRLDNSLALKLLRQAETFYREFVSESTKPEVLILHQVNPGIIDHLKTVFEKYELEFVDVSHLTGNCGAASVGIALDQVKHQLSGKKVLLCSFGTGGVITAGLWQM